MKELWLKDKFSVIISPFVVDEIRTILNTSRIKDKYLIKTSEIELFIELLLLKCITVFPTGKIQVCRDTRDNHVLEAALLGKAECIITRDDDLKRDMHLMETMKFNIEILSVNQFLELL